MFKTIALIKSNEFTEEQVEEDAPVDEPVPEESLNNEPASDEIPDSFEPENDEFELDNDEPKEEAAE